MASIALSELNILLIEPSAMQRKVIISHLQDAGITHIDGVGSAKEALALIEQYPPDLIISAMYLPDMSATQLLTVLNQRSSSSQKFNFMLISSENNFSALDPIRQAGVVAILPKPFLHEDLQRALVNTLDYLDSDELDLEHYDVTDLRVLIVDDSATARNHISRVLGTMGIINITMAENGIEAIKLLSEFEFDLIVTDFNMPEMDGQQLIQYIRGDMANSYIPIMMVTSEQDEARLGNVQQAGVSAICDKPFDPSSVRKILYRILDGRE